MKGARDCKMEMQRCVAALACYKLYKPLTRPSPPNYRPGNEGCSSNTNLTSFDTKMATLSYCVCLLMGWILTKCGRGIVQQVGPNNGRLSPDKLCPPISPQHQLQVRLPHWISISVSLSCRGNFEPCDPNFSRRDEF